jgi:hypothetical protein
MNKYGFYITNLRVTGENKKNAELSFKDGFNLITGVSDTGKTHIFNCINYMLGKSDSPISIPESIGYTNFYLSLKTYDGKFYTLYRKINAKKILIKECDIFDIDDSRIKFVDYSVNPKDEKNISTFLLKLNGIEDKYLKKSKSNKVKLIYSYIRKLTTISETTIVVNTSPFYPTAQFMDYTLYQSLIIYLITGKDFTNFDPIEKNEIRKSRLNGQKDFIGKRLQNISTEIEKLLNLQKPGLNNSIEIELNNLELDAININRVISELVVTRKEIYKEIEKIKSSILFIVELLERMTLLRLHYESDINRLSFIDEGQLLLSQLKTVNCPLCDSEIESEKLQEIEQNISIKNSIDSEREKIKLKMIDLESTILANKQELIRLEDILRFNNIEFSEINKEIIDKLNPKLDIIREKIVTLKEYYTLNSKLEILNKELDFYNSEYDKTVLLLKTKQVSDIPDEIDEILMKPYLNILKSVLKSWNYPNNEYIKFDSNSQVFDFMFSSKARGSYGKGMRAISYTAVIYSLIKYCIENSIPFTRNLIIDSPLTTYHGKEKKTKDDEIDVNIEHCFFKYFATDLSDFQFIVFDNKAPQIELINKINHIEFTGDLTNGRYGFFPLI